MPAHDGRVQTTRGTAGEIKRRACGVTALHHRLSLRSRCMKVMLENIEALVRRARRKR